jgi:hypothetical protein
VTARSKRSLVHRVPAWVLVLSVSIILVLALIHYMQPLWRDRNSTDERLQRAADYLISQYNPSLGLVAEAPTVAPNTYWLVSDNLLAQKALTSYDPAISNNISESLLEYPRAFKIPTNAAGLPNSYKHEAFTGDQVPLPFHTCVQFTLVETLAYVIKIDVANGSVLSDWRSYGDLLLYASLSAHYDGDDEAARQYFGEAVAMWDGMGIRDKHTNITGLYATYKLALLYHVAHQLNETLPFEEALLDRLWRQQHDNGGFITDYHFDGTPDGDTNTETTAIILIAAPRYVALD